MAGSTLAPIGREGFERARRAGAGLVRRTPVLSSATLGERCGGKVVLKAENLQRTGSFKLRGVLAKLDALGDSCGDGVVVGSAGNHAQAAAYAARARGIRCEVYMPVDAPLAKVAAAIAFGATVHRRAGTVDECVAAALERAREGDLTFVHPFDDLDVAAGQGTLGLELLEDVEDLRKVIVPLGGGGLASGVAIAVKAAIPDAEVVGVQVAGCAPYIESLDHGMALGLGSPSTIADGIAVKRPGEVTLPLVGRWVDLVVAVSEEEVAEAMVLLLERAKLVVEGAGAVGVAALLSGKVKPAAEGTTAVVLSGGNVDAGLLGSVIRLRETDAGRRIVLMTRISDRPGGLASLLTQVAETGANLLEVEHVRDGIDLHVRETAVELVLETRGSEHGAEVLNTLRDGGYEVTRLG